mgnify:FL=1
MERVFELKVDNDYSGKSIKEILQQHFKMSERLINKLKLENGILLNNQKRFVNTVVNQDDVIKIIIPSEKSDNIVPTPLDLDIVFEDDDILVVNKQPGIPVHPCQSNYSNTLANGIVYYWLKKGSSFVYRPVNRLDKDTSGLMIVAKNPYAHQQLAEQIINRVLKRTYIAFVQGNMEDESGTINAPIQRKPGSIMERMVSNDGQRAITHYKVLRRFKEYTKLEIKLETGRTHQIRVHMSHIGHPLLGDGLYGQENQDLILRHALHSASLNFYHPVSKKEMKFFQTIPEDMQRLEEKS